MTTTLPISEARKKLPSLVDKASGQFEHFVITRNGKPDAVLIGHEEYESWQKTLEVVADREELAGIQRGLAEIARGDTVSFEELFGEPVRGTKAKRRSAE